MTTTGSALSVMILCGSGPRHLYVANQLIQAGGVVAVVQEVGSRPTLKKLLRLLFKPSLLLQKIWRSRRDRRLRLHEREARFFFGDQPPKLVWDGELLAAQYINHPDVVALAARLRPDLICVFGTSLIREPLLSAAGWAMINLHGGLSPHYRGADCTFWAFYNQEPEQAGCTLHFIDPGIDTGKLIAHVRPEIRPDDDDNLVFWRGVRESAVLMAELSRRMGSGERFGVMQAERGRLYQVKERDWQAQRRLDFLLREGLLRDIQLPLRFEWFLAKSSSNKNLLN